MLPHWLQPAIAALTELGLWTGLARSAPVYATVSALHVLGIALLVGPVLLADLRLAGALRGLDAPSVTVLRRTALVGVLLALATGSLLLSAKPAEYAANPVVWTKLCVILAALLNALGFELVWRRRGEALLERGGLGFALLSMALWLAALGLGRWIAFV